MVLNIRIRGANISECTAIWLLSFNVEIALRVLCKSTYAQK